MIATDPRGKARLFNVKAARKLVRVSKEQRSAPTAVPPLNSEECSMVNGQRRVGEKRALHDQDTRWRMN